MAEVLGAEKLLMMTNTPGVLDKGGKLLRSLSAQTIDELFADGTISGGMLPKIASSLDAATNGVNSVHIVAGRVPHCLPIGRASCGQESVSTCRSRGSPYP